MELQEALEQIGGIRLQMSRTRIFRGYRAATTLATALAAVGAAVWQAWRIPHPAADPIQFADLWVAVAIGSIAMVSGEIVLWYRQSGSSLQRELTLLAVEQFLPCLIIGGLVTMIMVDFTRLPLGMLPGLWQIFFGLGFFASRRLLPGSLVLIGAFYSLCGLFNLAHSQDGLAYSPWAMAIPFGMGQAATAAILHFTLERTHAESAA